MHKNNRISIKTLYIMILLFPLVKADVDATAAYFGFFISEFIDDMLVIWQFASLFVSIVTIACGIKKNGVKSLRLYFVLECILCVSLIYSTLNNSSMTIYRIVRELLPGFVFLLVVNNYSERYFHNIIEAFYYDLTFVMIINSSFMYFADPWQINQGNSVYYLFGLDNYTFMITFCAFAAGIIINLKKKGKIGLQFIIVYIYIDGAYFYTRASTAMAISILSIIVCFIYKTNVMKLLNWKIVLLLEIFIFFSVVGSDFASKNFTGIFSALGKLSNFSGRAHIWDIGNSLIKYKPIWGYGIDSGQINRLMNLNGLSWEIGHLHNVVMEFLVKGGIIGFGIFVLMWLIEIYANRKSEPDNYIRTCIQILFLLSFLMYMFDYRIADYTSWIFLALIAEEKQLMND